MPKRTSSSEGWMLITAAEDKLSELGPRCGIVSRGDFTDYFGPFASRAFRSATEPTDINTASLCELRNIKGVGLITVEKIVSERQKRRLHGEDDVFKNNRLALCVPGFRSKSGPEPEPRRVWTRRTVLRLLKLRSSTNMLLWCAFVGAKRNAFSVEIDAREYVIDLKRAIKKLKEAALKDTDPDELELYLALTHDGKSWLRTDEFDVAQLTNGIVTAVVRDIQCGDNRLVGDDTIEEAFNGKPALGRKQLHLLVVPSVPVALPNGSPVPVTQPLGPQVNLHSCADLLAFLEREMTNKSTIVSRPHILAPDSLQFRLVGREAAIQKVSKCFKKIVNFAGSAASDRTQVAVPVCSGLSGLGKTRMLEEGGTVLHEMDVDPNHVVRVIVPYFNGFSPRPVEDSMPIEASFSWRLLYRFFLDKNCSHSFIQWFESRLPSNGHLLTLERAVEVIERKLREKLPKPATLYLFLGVDEYQKIDCVRARQTGSKTSILRQLVEIVVSLLCTQSSSMVLLPMFAGTDLGVIESSSIASSSYYVTKRLPMNLLSMNQVFKIVESNDDYEDLLAHAQVRRHLFILGGVPRWVVDYLKALQETRVDDMPVTLDCIDDSFRSIWEMYVDSYMTSLEPHQLVRLAAFAVSGLLVSPTESFDETYKWSRLRDSSMCLLLPRKPAEFGACDVRVPYALLAYVGSRFKISATDADRHFASALHDMQEQVDAAMVKLQPWQLWEIFGACFYAVRINALLVLGHSTVTLGDLLPGTLMSDETRKISVKLVPSRVIRCAGAFGASTPQLIPRKLNELERIDWTAGGHIVVNDDGGAGVDIFFALRDATTDKDVVIVDQRKRQFGKFQPSHASVYLGKLGACPEFLEARGARLVRGVMNCVSPSNLATYEVLDDCFVLSRDGSEQFHGTLAYHPACSPVVSINSASKTALKTVFQGDTKAVDQVVGEIMRKRQEPNGGFLTSNELLRFIQAKRLKVQLEDQYAEFSC